MATRLYFPSSGNAPASPAFNAGWEDTTAASRLKCVTTRISSAMTTVSFLDANRTDRDILFRQYVSDPLAAQTILAQTVKIQMRVRETHADNNMFLAWAVYVFSYDGAVLRGTVVALNRDATESTTTLTNRGDTATSTQVITQYGDRIVIEIGMGGNPHDFLGNAHDSDISIGDNSATDLPEDSTSTTANNAWLEFPNDVTINKSFESVLNNYQHVDASFGNTGIMSVTEKIK